jgi:hypothetical protein
MRTLTKIAIIVTATHLVWNSSLDAFAPLGRFTVSADTVKDEVTKLVWQRIVPETPCNGTYLCTWADATQYCKGLNLGGFASGWRLPGVKELTSIVDYRVFKPAIDQMFPNTPIEYFWTSSPDVFNPGWAWVVAFDYGNVSYDDVTRTNRVRCVH